MSDSYHLNAVVYDSIDQLERKAVKEIAPSPMLEERPAFRSLRDGFDPDVQFGQKRARGRMTSHQIPLSSRLGFLNGVGMENNGEARHQRPRIFRRASLQETSER